jgi:chromosome condensin MukBEF ATPase and DNA-binding subunit MukB
MMDDQEQKQHVQEVINKMLQDASPAGNMGGAEAAMGMIQHLERGLMEIAHSNQMLAQGLDFARLTIQMLQRVLVDADIVSKEDLEQRYENEVKRPMAEAQEQIKEQMKAAIAAQQQAAAKSTEPTQEPNPDLAAPAGDDGFQLPSEKFGGPKVFGKKE